jgi:MFS family permease
VTSAARTVFRALAYRNYRLWIAGLFVSGIGTWMQMTAQDWTVLTILTDHDAGALSVVVALQTAPQLFLLPIAGYASDRISRRRLLVITQCLQAALAVLLGVLLLTGTAQYWQVCVLAGLTGAVQAFDSPARNTFANELVDPEALGNAIALGGATFNLARLVGPAVAGVLIGVVGPGWIFIANAVTFVATLIGLGLMRVRELHPVARDSGTSGRWLGGLRYVARDKRLLTLILLVFVVVGFVGSSMNLLVITAATSEFDAQAEGFGILTSCIAAGSILGALFAASRRTPRIRLLVLGSAGVGLALAASAAMPGYIAFAAIMPVVGFMLMTTMATVNAAVQTMSEPGMRGRVMGVYMTAWMAGAPLGALVLGLVIDSTGPRVALLAAGVLAVLAAGGVSIAFRGLERMRVRRAEPADFDQEGPGLP